MPDDPFHLERFVTAQQRVYPQVVSELRAGAKRSHWMWFIFPQLAGLGRSSTAKFYGLQDATEAQAYWQHPLLGTRLRECFQILLTLTDRTAHEIFGSPDDLKLCSCATLFASISPRDSEFEQVIVKYYSGRHDARTQELLTEASGL